MHDGGAGGIVIASHIAGETMVFIIAVLAAGVLAGSLIRSADQTATRIEDEGRDEAAAWETDLRIVNDDENVRGDVQSDVARVLVKNTGSRDLSTEHLTVFADGSQTSFTGSLLDGADEWDPHVVARLNVTITGLDENEQHRVRVVHTPDAGDDVFWTELTDI